MTQPPDLVLIGCGIVFETIASTWPQLSKGERKLQLIRLDSTDDAANAANEQLSLLNNTEIEIFAAIDQNALNFARLEIYGQARLLGLKSTTLIHPSAIIAPDSRIGENCWIGAGAIIASGASIGNNTLINTGARIDYGAQIAENCWVGSGTSIGQYVKVGQHVVIGSDISLGANITVGRHCSIDMPGAYLTSLAEGTFIDSLFPSAVHIYTSKSANKTMPQTDITAKEASK